MKLLVKTKGQTAERSNLSTIDVPCTLTLEIGDMDKDSGRYIEFEVTEKGARIVKDSGSPEDIAQ